MPYRPIPPYTNTSVARDQAVLLFKKFLLIIAADTTLTDPVVQAGVGVAVHIIYLIIFEIKQPMPFYPSSSAMFKGQNFFHLVERSSCCASLVGSLMAILGAANPGNMTAFGTVFAVSAPLPPPPFPLLKHTPFLRS